MPLIDRSSFKSEFIKTSDAARVAGTSGQHIRRAIHSGRLRAYRMGSDLRIRLEDLEVYLNACLIEPTLAQGASEPTT